MEKRIVRKLKNKIWLLSVVMIALYAVSASINPAAWLGLLPVVIPAFVLAVGLPVGAAISYAKENKANLKIQPDAVDEILVKSNVVNDNSVVKNNRLQSYTLTDDCYETTQEKNKVKTKGTIR